MDAFKSTLQINTNQIKVLYSFAEQAIDANYNKIVKATPFFVPKKCLIRLTTNMTTKIGIDDSTNLIYSDYSITKNFLIDKLDKIKSNNNYKIMFRPLIVNKIFFTHFYELPGLYSIHIDIFLGSNSTEHYSHDVLVSYDINIDSDCPFTAYEGEKINCSLSVTSRSSKINFTIDYAGSIEQYSCEYR